MKKEAVIVRDADGNELYFAETIGECLSWCAVYDITGKNGEYIAIGTFDEESRYFEAEDYAEINDNMYKEG